MRNQTMTTTNPCSPHRNFTQDRTQLCRSKTRVLLLQSTYILYTGGNNVNQVSLDYSTDGQTWVSITVQSNVPDGDNKTVQPNPTKGQVYVRSVLSVEGLSYFSEPIVVKW
jgi:hypothetical protein